MRHISPNAEENFESKRRQMVTDQIEARGIKNANLLKIFCEIPRHRFVPPGMRHDAYEDNALPIGEDQTISQPYIVALMTQMLELSGNEKILEIGTGSGYQAAILSRLARLVFTIERIPELAQQAGETVTTLGCDNITVISGDGSAGLPDKAPFDAIVVTAAAERVPAALLRQLSPRGGRLVMPVGPPHMQVLTLIIRQGDRYEKETDGLCIFVPLITKS